MSRGSRGAPWISAPLTRPSSASTSSSGTFSRRTESWSPRYVTIAGDPSAPAHAELGRSAAAGSSTIAATALHAIVPRIAMGCQRRNTGAAALPALLAGKEPAQAKPRDDRSRSGGQCPCRLLDEARQAGPVALRTGKGLLRPAINHRRALALSDRCQIKAKVRTCVYIDPSAATPRRSNQARLRIRLCLPYPGAAYSPLT